MTWRFDDQLRRFGPGCRGMSRHAAKRYCKFVAESHYENFTVASWLLPRKLRPHFHAVYAWCRWADDLADETGDGTALLDWWLQELNHCYAGSPRHPVTIALADTITRIPIPQSLFENLLSAFQQDQRIKRYESFGDLVDYCRRSADPVGRIVLYLFDCFNDVNAALSDSICTGLQLANFWQDVARDHAIGRIYIPLTDCRRFRYSESDFENRVVNDSFRELMRFQVMRAREFFHRGEPLLKRLPQRARIDVTLFHRGGLAILDAIERQNYDVWTQRPEVSKREKLQLLMRSLIS